MIGHKGLRHIWLICFCAIIDKDKEGGNGVIGPLPLMQDAGNQDITEWVRLSSDNNSIITQVQIVQLTSWTCELCPVQNNKTFICGK